MNLFTIDLRSFRDFLGDLSLTAESRKSEMPMFKWVALWGKNGVLSGLSTDRFNAGYAREDVDTADFGPLFLDSISVSRFHKEVTGNRVGDFAVSVVDYNDRVGLHLSEINGYTIHKLDYADPPFKRVLQMLQAKPSESAEIADPRHIDPTHLEKFVKIAKRRNEWLQSFRGTQASSEYIGIGDRYMGIHVVRNQAHTDAETVWPSLVLPEGADG